MLRGWWPLLVCLALHVLGEGVDDDLGIDLNLATRKPMPSHTGLAKAKAEEGQDAGLHGFNKDDTSSPPPPGTKMVDIFDLVLSEQRNEGRELLFAKQQYNNRIHHGKISEKEMARLNNKEYRAAFRSALSRVITPTTTVLHVGAKTGLISLIAASLGAYHVYAVEGDEHLAAVATRVVEDNGLSDRITVINKNVTDLDQTDIPFKASLFINEGITTNLMASMMPYESHLALAKFVQEGAPVIPRVGNLHFMAIECAAIRKGMRVTGPVAGFDFSRLNWLAPSSQTIPSKDLNKYHFRAISDVKPQYMWRFDAPHSEERELPIFYHSEIELVSDGVLDSFAFFWDLYLDAETKISTNPQRGSNNWGHLGHILCHVTPREVKAGDIVKILVGLHVGLIKADIVAINGVPVEIPKVQRSDMAIQRSSAYDK